MRRGTLLISTNAGTDRPRSRRIFRKFIVVPPVVDVSGHKQQPGQPFDKVKQSGRRKFALETIVHNKDGKDNENNTI